MLSDHIGVAVGRELKKLAAECRLLDHQIYNLYERATVEDNRVVRINLDNCSLSEISHFPISLFKFSELRYLSLRQNNLHEIPEELGQLNKLEYLDLSFNEIDEIPEKILKLPNLRVLRVRNNVLSFFPDVSKLERLEELSLTANRLKRIDESIFGLTKLKKIYLAENELLTIDSSIAQISSLEYLNLRSNNIGHIPKETFQASNIQKLNLYGNPLELNLSYLRQCSPDLKIFVDDMQSELRFIPQLISLTSRIIDYRFDPRYPPIFGVNNQGKLVNPILIYGGSKVGKKSLVESFIYNHYIPQNKLTILQNRYMNWDHYLITHNDLIYQLWYPFVTDMINPNSNTSVLNGFYYSNAIILIFDLSDRKSFQNILQYIQRIVQIRHYLCPIIVVGNKSEKLDRTLDRSMIRNVLDEISNRIGMNLPYIETSVVEDYNIKQVFDLLFSLFSR